MSVDFVPCERTVRMCIDALPALTPPASGDPAALGYYDGVHECIEGLEAFLPKPNRAEELYEEFKDWFSKQEASDGNSTKTAIRWLIERGEIKG